MFTHSIRWRLQLWLGFLLLIALSGFGLAVYQLQRANDLSQLDEELERRVGALNVAVRGGGPPGPGGRRPPADLNFSPPPDGEVNPRGGPREVRLDAETNALFANTRADAFYFVIWSRGGSLLIRSTNGPDEVPLPQRLGRDTRIHRRTRDPFRESYQFTELGDCVLVGRSLSAHWRSQRRLAWTIVATGGAALALGFGGGWWLTTRAIRPVEVISAAASRISAGNLFERIATAEPDNEIGRLAEVLNRTFARLEAAFTRQKQFTADAAHELRTPLAVLISEAQTALARERGAAEYRESLETTLETAQRMRRLTESLLELARFDAGHESLHREKFDLAQTTRERVELLRPIAAQRDIQIHCELAPTVCEGDSERLAQVITNILANAIHYNRDGGEIRILTASEGDASVLAVSDTGVGIASEELPHVFERFYRADKSRSRAEGSSGLGLAISKAIVEAHGGDISVHSELGTGTTFTVRLPSKRIR